MEHDLGIGAAAYGFGAGLFFIGYALFEVPSNMLLQSRRAPLADPHHVHLGPGRRRHGVHPERNPLLHPAFSAGRGRSRVLSRGDLLLHPLAARRRARQGHRHFPQRLGRGLADLRPAVRALLQINGLGMHGWQWMYFIEGMFSVGAVLVRLVLARLQTTTPNG
jgi:hypothetical protein